MRPRGEKRLRLGAARQKYRGVCRGLGFKVLGLRVSGFRDLGFGV